MLPPEYCYVQINLISLSIIRTFLCAHKPKAKTMEKILLIQDFQKIIANITNKILLAWCYLVNNLHYI